MRTPLDLERFLYAARPFEFSGRTLKSGERFATTGVETATIEKLWESGAIDHDAHDPKVVSPPTESESKSIPLAGLTPGKRVTFRAPPRSDDEE
jgi:hypothetical protein